jgi:hypothetical protein
MGYQKDIKLKSHLANTSANLRTAYANEIILFLVMITIVTTKHAQSVYVIQNLNYARIEQRHPIVVLLSILTVLIAVIVIFVTQYLVHLAYPEVLLRTMHQVGFLAEDGESDEPLIPSFANSIKVVLQLYDNLGVRAAYMIIVLK